MKIIALVLSVFALLPSLTCAQIGSADSLISHYTFDNIVADTAYNITTNAYHAILTGTNIVDGIKGNALEFNNLNCHIDAGITPDVKHFTMMAWIKPYSYVNATPDNNILVFEKSNSYYMNIMSNSEGNRKMGHLRVGGLFKSPDGKTQRWEYLDSPSQIPLNKWTHAAFTFDGEKLRIYINGEPVTEKSVLPVLVNYQSNTVWGAVQKIATGQYLGYFNGALDECRLYGKKLEDNEIMSIYRLHANPTSAKRNFCDKPTLFYNAKTGHLVVTHPFITVNDYIIRVTDLMGRTVMQDLVVSNEQSFELPAGLPGSIYLALLVESKKGVVNSTFFKGGYNY